MPVKIFFCYAREDETYLNKLRKHLKPLQRHGLIDVRYDRDITAGTEWEKEINEHLNTAQIILLLVSPDFMESDYCYGKEMKRALDRYERNEARVIPIILRHVYWREGPLGKLQALPADAKPVKGWRDDDEAYVNIVENIRKVIEELTPISSATSLITPAQGVMEPNKLPFATSSVSSKLGSNPTPIDTAPVSKLQSAESKSARQFEEKLVDKESKQISMTKIQSSPSMEPLTPSINHQPTRLPAKVQPLVPSTTSGSLEELPDWMIRILNDTDKTELINKQAASAPAQSAPVPPAVLQQVSESVLASTATLPENVRLQVVQCIQDIQRYIDHGLLTPATEECLRVIDLAPLYLDIHLVLCEIYVRQGKVDQAITKYAILIDTYVVNGRIEDAIATYRRILQLEPNNLTYRVRLINLLATQGNKEDLLRERSLAAESYLRLGYMDRALTELEQALQESPTSVTTRLNYALALQKLGRSQQAVAEYQRVLQVDPRNITALVRWHIAMITGVGTARATTLEVLTRIRWHLRGEGQKNYETVVREYTQAEETYPNNADIWFALGQIHQQSGYFDQALDDYQHAIQDSSYEVLVRISSAYCMLAQGQPEPAIYHLEVALNDIRSFLKAEIDPAVWTARPREEGEKHQTPEVEISLLLAKAYESAGKQEQMEAILRKIKPTMLH